MGSVLGALDRLSARQLALLFLAPFLYGAVQQILKVSHWFTDYEAMSCGAQALNAGLDLYAGGFACPGAFPTEYVYTPHAARLFALFQSRFGISLSTALYGAGYLLIAYWVARALLADRGGLRARAPFLAVFSASALTFGNISVVIHGLILLLARRPTIRPALLFVAVAAAAILKPTFAVYAALFLFLDRPARARLAWSAASVAAVAAYFAYFRLSSPDAFAGWAAAVHFNGLVALRGHGFLGLPFVSEVQDPALLLALYGLFAAAILASGLILAERGAMREQDRLALGIAVCILLYPRLMFYDVYTLPFGLAVALSGFERFGRLDARHLALLVQIACLACAPIGGRVGGRLLFDIDCALLLGLAAMAALAARRAGLAGGLRAAS